MKFAFYVSNNATRLKKFFDIYQKHNIIKNIAFVLIDNLENQELKEKCNFLDIDYYEISLLDKKNKNQYLSDIFLDKLEKYGVKYGFVFADKILVGNLLKYYNNRLINFHPSILPAHKGLYAIDKALKEKTFLLGNTAHFITKEIDKGAVIMQNIFPAHNFINYSDILDNQIIMLLQIMVWIKENRLKVDEYKGDIFIKDASYKVSDFIPNIEIDIWQ